MSGLAQEKKKEEVEEREKGCSVLPWDMWGLIRLRLYAGDSVMFGAVCKSWRSINPPIPPMQIDLPLININNVDPRLRDINPYLMNLDCKTDLFHFCHPITNAIYIADLPDLVDEHIRFSKDGWVLVCSRPESVFFFNPFTRTRVQVPPFPLGGFRSMHFSCPPTQSCTVFGVFASVCKYVFIGTFRHGGGGGGGETWSIQNFLNNEDFLLSKCNPVLHDGLYYCLGHGGNLGIFDPQNNTWNVMGKPLDSLKKCQQSFLLESDGDLFGVFVANGGKKIEVLQLFKSSDLVWHQVKSLKDKMFYVSYQGSYSKKADTQGTGNKIYFRNLYNGEVLFYSLGTRRYHSFRGNISKQDLSDTKEIKHGIWIDMPTVEN